MYRLVFADNQQVSPTETRFETRVVAEMLGREHWEKQTGRKLIVIEDKPAGEGHYGVRPVEKGSE